MSLITIKAMQWATLLLGVAVCAYWIKRLLDDLDAHIPEGPEEE